MKITKYVIQLNNTTFAQFEQVSNDDIDVYSVANFDEAMLLNKDEAEKIFKDMLNPKEFLYGGSYDKPIAIREVELTLK